MAIETGSDGDGAHDNDDPQFANCSAFGRSPLGARADEHSERRAMRRFADQARFRRYTPFAPAGGAAPMPGIERRARRLNTFLSDLRPDRVDHSRGRLLSISELRIAERGHGGMYPRQSCSLDPSNKPTGHQ
jgi:hypothetical protein